MNQLLRASWVIARRDFVALVRSKAFIFFLIGPLLMLGIALAAGQLGNQVAEESAQPVIALAMPAADANKLIAARNRIDASLASPSLPQFERVEPGAEPVALLREGRKGAGYAAILSGSLDAPLLTATAAGIDAWTKPTHAVLDIARHDILRDDAPLPSRTITLPAAPDRGDRIATAQLGQMLLFLLTMLLAGMALSNLVEEKTNKIIEILAASIPLDAIFLGKLFAMLAMAFVGIFVWSSTATLTVLLGGSAMPALPAPAIGWPWFLILGVAYFSTAYLLLGSIFLGVGAMAATVREVQTLSMPVTMVQLLIFFFASYSLPKLGQPIEIAACILPLSSPFAMLARAAQQDALWPHLLALLWQGAWTGLLIRIGTGMFRRNVLKSGRQKKTRRPKI